MIRILFVCTGNTCRSPMAEALLKSKNIRNVEVKSAGVYAANGNNASIQAQEVLKGENIQYDHKSSLLTSDLVNWATHILTMTNSHKFAVLEMFPSSVNKTYTMMEFAKGDTISNIGDPFGGSVELYRKTFHELEELISLIIQKIE